MIYKLSEIMLPPTDPQPVSRHTGLRWVGYILTGDDGITIIINDLDLWVEHSFNDVVLTNLKGITFFGNEYYKDRIYFMNAKLHIKKDNKQKSKVNFFEAGPP